MANKPSQTYQTTPVKAGNLKSDDIVFALMGPTGSGKSQIIDSLTGQKTRAGTSLKSVTDEVSAHRVIGHETYGNKLVLVDTPGLDDSHKSDKTILKMISEWMTKTYKHHKTLTGILYIHRITDVRMSSTPHRNLRMFGELCGNKYAINVVLLTTMWDKVRSITEAEKREASLKERYWNAIIHHGATVDRFYKNGPKSPWETINEMVQRHKKGQALLLQEEMVDIGKRLNETNAGKALYRDLQGLIEKQNKTIKSLEDQAKGGRTDADVQAEMEALRAEADRIMKEFESMKIPLGRKFALFFKKKETSHSIQVGGA